MKEYDHKKIEQKWQKWWRENNLYDVRDQVKGKDNFYALVEFPYPSGNLHLGHWYAFAVPDMYARFLRMNGNNVLYPIGFDAFGLPAENAAIKRNLDPREWTDKNIEYMTGQLERMGSSFDWSREIRTSNPEYYRWTQWFFTQLFENDLAYRKPATVNWCPGCQTVLANEQVIEGECERCGTEVEQKQMEQWFFRITEFSDALIDDLDKVDFPEAIKSAQKNWIGRKEGAEISFSITDSGEELTVFTTRPDTLYGATFMVVAPEHEVVQNSNIKNDEEIEEYVSKAKSKTERERQESKEKTGVELKGVRAINPATQKEIPIFVADYVLGNYGTGAIMAVPAHDERDFEFAKKYDLPIKEVVVPERSDKKNLYMGEGFLINSGEFDGLSSEEAKKKITESVGGEMVTTYRLRDWSVGRQRYWGTPIPIVYDPDGQAHPVPEEHLPWTLPSDVDHTPSGESPLARSEGLKKRTEDIFGEGWTPEVETMDTFVDSAWYYLRYTDPRNNKQFASSKAQKSWMPVDFYSGGAEHTTMHLLYSRFFYKALSKMGFVEGVEPYARRMNRGLILGPDGHKMSKSRGNVVDPDEQVERVGADTVRMYLAFVGPYDQVGTYPWDMGGIVGIRRFLERVWKMSLQVQQDQESNKNDDADLETVVHQTIQRVTEDIEGLKFNTAIAGLMECLNTFEDENSVSPEHFEIFLCLLAPFAPHLTEEIWQSGNALKREESVHLQSWPEFDPNKITAQTVTVAVQINGKVRAEIEAIPDISKEEIESQALANSDVEKWIDRRKITRVIYVPRQILNIVTE